MSKTSELTYNYQFLARLQMDCDYFLGNGNRKEKHLWALNVEDHIKEMYKTFDKLPTKPDWITLKDIGDYHQKMKFYESRAANEARQSGYGSPSYWNYLENSSLEKKRYFLGLGDKERAERMLTRTLSEALQGNEGI